ncbi:MAG: hypothetical protein ABEH66_04885 [Halobacteriales archaeon]
MTAPPDGRIDDDAPPPDPSVEDLLEDLEAVAEDLDSPEAGTPVRGAEDLLAAASDRGILDSGLRRLDPRDAAEAFVGTVIFASPLLVEDGVFDIADHLFGVTVMGVPAFLVANTLFVVVLTYALLEWTGRDRVEVRDVLGIVPARLVMTLAVSFLASAVLMTIWGRVDPGSPVEAIARINVLWTVGSIGAALGDILADDSAPSVDRHPGADHHPGTDQHPGPDDRPDGTNSPDGTEELSDGQLLASLHEGFDELESRAESEADREEIRRLRARARGAATDEPFGERIRKYTTRDVAEAFVGSVIFSIPFLVEDGVFDVANYFLSVRVGAFPVFFVLNAAFVLVIVEVLVYRTGPQDVQVYRPLFGVVPRRLVGITVVSFLTAAALMTMWGRVGGWTDPVVAVARVSAVWTVAAFGAALGDILPGESSGDDINDDLAELGERITEGDGRSEG